MLAADLQKIQRHRLQLAAVLIFRRSRSRDYDQSPHSVFWQTRQFAQFADCLGPRASSREHLEVDHAALVLGFAMINKPRTIARDEKIRILVLVKRTAATAAWFRGPRQIVMLPQPRNRDALLYLRTDFACRRRS